ncbi:FadR/GntR family transcriptional regulator [Amycolatopsis alkalitolerans]|uniref:FadR family transcriptional regulator n=1 Tax=Amycolatopsis alkalitolerans TaxID=2547244 RepID=A0A5C4MBQ9_9PSEU|nr:FCD domain-containing protein [Amycolatopsis alkalitolerans]TNC29730.1 FadR family transcriptional regulator [Amycolatopsis alkalitolerans]
MTRRAETTGNGPSLSDRLATGLLELIAELRLSPGDPLPTVRELAQRFSVTPPTIREALRRLQATDAVRLRHGSGVYVGAGLHRTLMANPNSAPLQDELVLQMVDARITIEPGIAALAAAHRTEDDLTQLELALDTALRDLADNRPHLNFHRELASASRNQVLFEVVDSLLTVRAREQRMVRVLIHDRRRDYDQHLAIFQAVRDGDPAQAERLTREHLHQLREDITERLG